MVRPQTRSGLHVCRRLLIRNRTIVGDAALTLLKAGADYTRRSKEGMLPIDLAPDKEVGSWRATVLCC